MYICPGRQANRPAENPIVRVAVATKNQCQLKEICWMLQYFVGNKLHTIKTIYNDNTGCLDCSQRAPQAKILANIRMYSERVLEKNSDFFQMKTIKIQKKSEFCSLPRKNSEFFQKIQENGKNSEFFQKIQSFVSCGHPEITEDCKPTSVRFKIMLRGSCHNRADA